MINAEFAASVRAAAKRMAARLIAKRSLKGDTLDIIGNDRKCYEERG
jgi:hypothetical protein